MTRTRIAVAAVGDDTPRLETVDLPSPRGHQVLVEVEASGVCRSQLNHPHQARQHPRALGHEAVGTVVARGSAVRSVSTGDRVLITWLPRHRRHVPWPGRVPLASGDDAWTPDVFTWADLTLVDEAFVVRLPSTARGDVLSVLGCAVLTGAGAVCRTAAVGPGDSVAVIGVGGVGGCAVAAAGIAGASPIAAIDVRAENLALAVRMGATHAVDATGLDARAIRDELGCEAPGAGFDHVLDCVGAETTLTMAVDLARAGIPGTRRGGTVVVVGVPPAPVSVDLRKIQLEEKRILGSYGGSSRPAADLPRYLGWYLDGRLDLDLLVSQRYPLADVATAVSDLAEGIVVGRSVLVP